MKAAQSARVVGIALEPFDAAIPEATGGVLVFLNPHWYAPEVTPESLQGGEESMGPVLNTYTFDPNTIYSFEHLRVQDLEVGSEERPTGFTIYDVVTKKPYCIMMQSGAMISVEGKCSDRPANSSEPAENTSAPSPSETPAPNEPAEETAPASSETESPAMEESLPAEELSSPAPTEESSQPAEETSAPSAPAEESPTATESPAAVSEETSPVVSESAPAPSEPEPQPEPASSAEVPAQ
jgi:hypothetical protein